MNEVKQNIIQLAASQKILVKPGEVLTGMKIPFRTRAVAYGDPYKLKKLLI